MSTVHPLDLEEIAVSVQPLAEGYVALVRHIPTGLLGQGFAETASDAEDTAKDALLKLIEEAGGG